MTAENSTPDIPDCRVIGTFPLGDKICDVLSFHRPNGILSSVSGREMLARGRQSRASMSENDFWFFWDGYHFETIPNKYWRLRFVFPEFYDWVGGGCVICIARYYDWYTFWFCLDGDWGNDNVLVRLSDPTDSKEETR